jgi:hypothetical protein
MKDTERDPDGLIPRDKVDYGNLSEAGIQAARQLARNMVSYERSNTWYVRICKKFGVTWWHLLGIKLRISIWKNSVVEMVNGTLSSIDNGISRFNQWLLNH